jgi:hypothetical protein
MSPQCEDAIEVVKAFLEERYVTPVLYKGLIYADYCTISTPGRAGTVNVRWMGDTRLSVAFPTALHRRHIIVDLHDPDSLDLIQEFCECHLGKKR